MQYLPVFLDLNARRCAVVGGSEVAARMIRLLVQAGARVTAIAPGLCDEVRRLADEGRISHVASPFLPEFLRGVQLVIAATGDRAVDRQVSETAAAMGIPVNVADAPELGTFVVPAIMEGNADALDRGSVYLIGAGPGDPELLTLRALRLLQQADVIVYDSLIGDGILELARRDAERIYVGKRCSRHSMPQEEINQLLVRLATAGKQVARLKGGDPFFFGRGGEELEALAGCGVPYEVVPGITAANGVASHAGIPLTHRDYAQSCVFATGHLKDGTVNLDWEALARPHQTAVIYMGLGGLPVICRELVRHGLSAGTPAAAIQSATTRNQRVVAGTLETLPDLVAAVGLASPVLVIVGEVVKLHRQLAWFASGPIKPATATTDKIPEPYALDPIVLASMQRHTT